MQFLRIDAHDPLYPQTLALREAVLLGPVGYTADRFKEAYPGIENRFEHFVAVVDSHAPGEADPRRVVGVVCLLPGDPDPGSGKLMQMAVDPQRRGEGLGSRLLVELERRAFAELGLAELYCHAQLPAVPFYERHGWAVEGDEFEEAGIPHRVMRFRNTPPTG